MSRTFSNRSMSFSESIFRMSHDPFLHHLAHAIGHQSQHERKHGNSGGANGLAMIVLGIMFLPIPFIGIPLLLIGICKAIKGQPAK